MKDRLFSDLWIEADEGLLNQIFGEDFVVLATEILGGEIVPAEAREFPLRASQAGSAGSVVGNPAAEQVTEEGLDGVGFGEH